MIPLPQKFQRKNGKVSLTQLTALQLDLSALAAEAPSDPARTSEPQAGVGLEPQAGQFDVEDESGVRARAPSSPTNYTAGAFQEVGELFEEERSLLGIAPSQAPGALPLRFIWSGQDSEGKSFCDAGFELNVALEGVTILAASPRGLFYATRSLVAQMGSERALACGVQRDFPRYRWRGVHLDVSRHFYGVDFIKKMIDWLALHKLNIFHWHLTDDQGWRVEIDAYPELTRVSAFRKGEDGKPYGGFYTKAEIREVVAYAKSRFVEVVPEIELPGHAVATLAAYPELSCSGGPFEVETNWGIFKDVYCAGKESVFTFLETVLEEVIELFPSEFLHIGGDECVKDRWKTCADCQQRIKAEGLQNEDELQSYVVSRIGRFLSERGRRLVGWDEILEGGLAPGATVMSWRGVEGGIRAAEMGHDVVMSPTSNCYLDYKQSEDENEPGAWFAPALSVQATYEYEPTPEELSENAKLHVLGVQGNIWTERMPTEAQVEYMAFPRICALSEVAWSSAQRDYADFEQRLQRHLEVLDLLGVRYRGSAGQEPVRPTAEEIERFRRSAKERGLTAYS